MAARWLTPAEAARKLGVSESTVWRFLRREQLPSVKLGGRRRIPASAVGQLVRPLRPVKAEDIPPLTLESPLFALAGRFVAGPPGRVHPTSTAISGQSTEAGDAGPPREHGRCPPIDND